MNYFQPWQDKSSYKGVSSHLEVEVSSLDFIFFLFSIFKYLNYVYIQK